MKTIYSKALIILSVLFILCCCNKEKEQAAVVRIKFEGIEGLQAWAIVTEKNDTSAHIDTIEYGWVSKVNNYTILIEFDTQSENGDYLIYADSIDQVNIISHVEVFLEEDHYVYTFQFNGEPKSSKNKEDLHFTITK